RRAPSASGAEGQMPSRAERLAAAAGRLPAAPSANPERAQRPAVSESHRVPAGSQAVGGRGPTTLQHGVPLHPVLLPPAGPSPPPPRGAAPPPRRPPRARGAAAPPPGPPGRPPPPPPRRPTPAARRAEPPRARHAPRASGAQQHRLAAEHAARDPQRQPRQ